MKSKGKSLGYQTKSGFVMSEFETPDVPDYVIAELRYESPVAFTTTKFAAPAAAKPEAESLNKILERFEIDKMGSHFQMKIDEVKERIAVANALPVEPDIKKFKSKGADEEFLKSGFVQIVPKKGSDAKKIAQALQKHGSVWQAYVAPRPVPASLNGPAAGSRNFEPSQGYLCSAPDGIDAMGVWPLAGAKGKGVTICDIEGAWNLRHEDLPAGIQLIGGNMLTTLDWRNHGTAVLGEMVSVSNQFGTVGISREATAVVNSAFTNGVFNTAAAITNATSKLKAGDVILIELQATGPNGKYVAMQYWDDIYTAIKAAVAKGITVVEAAGNGNDNFDLPVFNGTGLQKDSGAIVVGAGIPPTNYFDVDGFGAPFPGYSNIGVPRSRIFFSNYGKIVNVQGWGWHVSTLGYGDAQGGSASENNWYTLRFSGTSSASPIVTGAVACLQGRAKAKNGAPLTPARVRKILMDTGTPQQAGPGVPLTQNIGPLPNLAKAMTQV
ncbi:MAG TPA: S8 family serine peptidase [Pyrinomonadaceae bacterium]|jgi:subtilisin family serine protease|nr:S8 family serine peptidase [Pyrinomonadaceae bacterium]